MTPPPARRRRVGDLRRRGNAVTRIPLVYWVARILGDMSTTGGNSSYNDYPDYARNNHSDRSDWEPLSEDRDAGRVYEGPVWEQPDYLNSSSPSVSDPVRESSFPPGHPYGPPQYVYMHSARRGPSPFAALAVTLGVMMVFLVLGMILIGGLMMGGMMFPPIIFFILPVVFIMFGRRARRGRGQGWPRH